MKVARIVLPAWLGTTPTAFRFGVALGGQQYRFRFVWDNRANGGAGAWRVDLRAKDGTALILGRKLVLTDDLYRLFHYKAGMPPGRLRVYRPDNGTTDPGAYDLAGAVVLEYVED